MVEKSEDVSIFLSFPPHLVQFSCSAVSDSLWHHGLKHTRLLCPLPTPGACSKIRVFSNKSVLCIRWPKCWSFSFWISPSNEYLGLISFRMDWLDLLAVQGNLKSLLQHHSLKISLALSYLYGPSLTSIMTTGKTITLTRWAFVSKVMSLLFNMLSRLVITFLPRSKHLLISWPQLPSAVILKPKKIKSLTVSIVSPSICHEMMGPDAMIFVFWRLSFKLAFHSSLPLSSRGSLVPLLSAIGWYNLHIWGYQYFSLQSWV